MISERTDMPGDNKTARIRLIFTIIFTLLMAGSSITSAMFADITGGFSTGSLPLLTVGALCGYMAGIIAEMLTLVFSAVTEPLNSYVITMYLIAVLMTAAASRKKVYKSLPRTLLLGVFIAAVTGAARGLVLNITRTGDLGPDIAARTLRAFAYALPESEAAMLISYALFRFLPDRAKQYIPNGMYYMESGGELQSRIEERIREMSSRLSFRVTRVIVVEAVILSFLAALVAIHLTAIINEESLRPRDTGAGMTAAAEEAGETAASEGEGSAPAKPEEKGPEATDAPDSDETTEARKTGILGEAMGTEDSGEWIFDDRQRFNPFRKNIELDRRMTMAFSFRLVMVLFSAAIIISALADAYMQATVARPIRKMSKAMKGFAYSEQDGRIGGTGELKSIRIRSRDEIEELYNALVKTVDDTEDYLERLREGDRIKNELEVAKASNEAKSAFLSSMSHEIRTPINAVLGFDEMILLENKDPEIGRYAEDIRNAGRTLLALVNDILDFSKIEAGKMEIVPGSYELTSLINDAVSMTMSLANDKNLDFEVKVDPAIPHLLYGDEIRIKQCMTNILSNAVKYTEHGGLTLNVGFEKAEEPDSIYLKISVKDTGIGIRQEDMGKLFSAFDRLDQVRNKAVKGTGLGLSITKQLLESMGSVLEVESEYEKGSDFHFSLLQKVEKWEEIGDLSEAFKKYVPHGEAAQKDDDFYAPKASILVTDDTESNLLVVTRLLKRTGIQIDTVDSGASTLNMVKKKKYDLIYLDHMMPEMDGIETLHAMESLEGNMNTETPVIVLTANAVAGSREMYMKEGFTDYMTKPVSYRMLRESLLRYLPADKVEKREACPDDTETESAATPIPDIEGIDVREGIKNTGDEETLLEVIKRFAEGIDDNADRIERELSEQDIKDYTVHVHALKSSSRLIGALELSEMALELEKAGNAYLKSEAEGDETAANEALSKISRETPELLSLYRSFSEKLAGICDPGTGEAGEKLTEITEEELNEMLNAIREFAEAFDMDTADSVMAQLEDCSVPDDKKEMVSSLKKAVRNVDRDAILSLLAGV